MSRGDAIKSPSKERRLMGRAGGGVGDVAETYEGRISIQSIHFVT